MGTTTIAKSSIETISRKIRLEFDALEWYDFERGQELIMIAKSYSLNDLAEEMENDLSL